MLGLRTSEEYGLMWLHLAGGRDTLVYEQPDATPASFTILNFEVTDIVVQGPSGQPAVVLQEKE